MEICGGEQRLIARPEPYDVIVVDAVRPNTAYAGNLYSVELYELVSSRLAANGVFVQWIPTDRVINSASNQPLFLDRATLRERLSKVDLEAAFDPQQRQRLIESFDTAEIRRQPRQLRKLHGWRPSTSTTISTRATSTSSTTTGRKSLINSRPGS